MNGSNHRSIERALKTEPTLSFIRRGREQNFIESGSEALAHFVCRAIGESDGDDLINGEVSFTEYVQVTLHQHRGFTGARAGGHRNVAIDGKSSGGLLRF